MKSSMFPKSLVKNHFQCSFGGLSDYLFWEVQESRIISNVFLRSKWLFILESLIVKLG